MSLIIMILLLSFLILIHEAGHFLAARALGIKVDKFGFGLPFGPTLWSKKAGGVEILIHACLLGGYVAFPDDDKDSDLPSDSKDRFTNRPVWQRMIVISAGVISNVITAILLVILTASIWGKLPSGNYQIFVNKIAVAKSASVWDSGMQKNDRIVSINGSKITNTYAISLYSKNSARYDGKVDKRTVDKTLKELEKLNSNLDPFQTFSAGISIKLPANKEVIEQPLKISDEALKGYTIYKNNETHLTKAQLDLKKSIKPDAKYLVSDGTVTLHDLAYALSDGLKPLNITVERNGKLVNLKTIYPDKNGLIGIMMKSKEDLIKTSNPVAIVSQSCKYIWEQTYMLLYGLWQLFTGKIPAKDLHGIVVIAKIGSDVIHNSGLFSGLLLTAMISMDLALVNFLPIPALDGGHFMFLCIEKLRGKPLKPEHMENITTIFFLLLIVFMFLVIFNDVYALVKHQL